MFEHDSFFFLGIFVFIFLFWLVTGGPSHPISFAGPLLSGPQELGGGTYLSLPRAPTIGGPDFGSVSASPRGGTQNIQNQIVNANSQVSQLQKQLADAKAFGAPSPYRGQVTMSHYVSASGGNAQNEYVQLYVTNSADGPINISGWKLESDVTGNAAVIPQGTEVPVSGLINAIEPVKVKSGDTVIVATGRSPIGASFRENKCISYFSQFQTFNPVLSYACPVPSEELKLRYQGDIVRDPSCVDYVNSLSRCTLAITPPINLSTACQNFLTTNLNYNGCRQTHETDYDFKLPTWRVYLGRDTPLFRTTHEAVKLLDENGKTVDYFTY